MLIDLLKAKLGEDFKDDMTIEELTALIAPDQADQATRIATLEAEKAKAESEAERYKTACSTANSEAAEYKRQLKAKLTESEQAELERAEAERIRKEHDDATQNRIKELEDAQTRAGLLTTFLGIGYDAELAKEAADAQMEGNLDAFADVQKRFLDAEKARIQAEATKGTPRPDEGIGGGEITKEKFAEMKFAEQAKFKTEQPDAYARLIKED